ncbi:hypothetical protein [Lactobacillus mulieris]|uniref:hypothetical protein n=1 Tax=Lactobacillus mulieris TaxID=2508708 RepID=UPI0022AC88A2|nr:hypothetical protein [Lactobacillus mulieris]
MIVHLAIQLIARANHGNPKDKTLRVNPAKIKKVPKIRNRYLLLNPLEDGA